MRRRTFVRWHLPKALTTAFLSAPTSPFDPKQTLTSAMYVDAMSTKSLPNDVRRRMTFGLTAAYVLIIALGLNSFDAVALLLFAGPLMIASFVSAIMNRPKATCILLAFALPTPF